MNDINWHDYFYYDETSPSCLRWKMDRRAGATRQGRIMAAAHAPVGTLQSIGYYTTTLGSKQRYVHRILWSMFKGQIPPNHEVDHIDGNRSNNCLANLRCTTRATNLRNANMRSTNKSGVNGVCLNAKGTVWSASWWTLGAAKKRKGKSFSVGKYGYEEAFRMACEFRKKIVSELNAEGATYSEDHGTRLPFNA